MTKLEEEIAHAMTDAQWGLAAPETVTMEIQAKAAAEVARRWMRLAWDGANKVRVYKGDRYTITFEEWIKENGATADPGHNIETVSPAY